MASGSLIVCASARLKSLHPILYRVECFLAVQNPVVGLTLDDLNVAITEFTDQRWKSIGQHGLVLTADDNEQRHIDRLKKSPGSYPRLNSS